MGTKHKQVRTRGHTKCLKDKKLHKLAKRATAPLPREYHPELDTTKELGHEQVIYYQSQIGVLPWAVELGRVDIITEVST